VTTSEFVLQDGPAGEEARTEAATLETEWRADRRWRGIARRYSGEEVVRLRGSVRHRPVLASLGAERLWKLLSRSGHVRSLGP
jgi:isocitrate lyase